MARERAVNDEETEPLTQEQTPARTSDEISNGSVSSASTTSLILEHINHNATNGTSPLELEEKYRDEDSGAPSTGREELDLEDGRYIGAQPVDKKARRLLWILATVCVVGWGLALVSFLVKGNYKPASTRPHDPLAPVTKGSGRKITLDSVHGGQWWPTTQSVSWIAGPKGTRDGMLLETGVAGKDYLVVEDIRQGMIQLRNQSRELH
jgi:dipeptidyl aminopeptidase